MPGKSPYEANEAYLSPLKLATSCLSSRAHLQPKRARFVGGRGFWDLGDKGVSLKTRSGASAIVVAGQEFACVECDPEEFGSRYRISTRSYSYELSIDGAVVLRMDWHPTGVSKIPEAHIHTQPDDKLHIYVGRCTFEDFVLSCFEYGVEPARSDAVEVLKASRDLHVKHRTWNHASWGDPST